MIEIKKISASETYEIRKNILRENSSLTEKMDGDFDIYTIHLGVYINGKLGCVATFMQHNSDYFEGSQYRLRGMATQREYQHQGLGKKVLAEAERILLNKGVKILWCNARVFTLKFYKNCGYKTIGEEFEVHLVGPHYVMYKELQK